MEGSHLIVLADTDETSLQDFNLLILGAQLGAEDAALLLQGVGQGVRLLAEAEVGLLQPSNLLLVLLQAGLAQHQLLLGA